MLSTTIVLGNTYLGILSWVSISLIIFNSTIVLLSCILNFQNKKPVNNFVPITFTYDFIHDGINALWAKNSSRNFAL